jgi:hypothetical protein
MTYYKTTIIKFTIGLVGLLLFSVYAFAQTQTIDANGKFVEPLWQKAEKIFQHDSATIYLLQSNTELAIGIVLIGKLARYVDLYIKAGQELYNLHASFQAGQRVLPDTGFTDDTPVFIWSKQSQWKVNTAKYLPKPNESYPLRNQLEAYEGYEFIISKKLFEQRNIKLFIEVKGFEEGIKPIVYPATTKYEQSKWAKFNLSY